MNVLERIKHIRLRQNTIKQAKDNNRIWKINGTIDGTKVQYIFYIHGDDAVVQTFCDDPNTALNNFEYMSRQNAGTKYAEVIRANKGQY